MSERLQTLHKSREWMVEDRDGFAKVLTASFDRDKAERARIKFIEMQVPIDAIDRAIGGDKARSIPTTDAHVRREPVRRRLPTSASVIRKYKLTGH